MDDEKHNLDLPKETYEPVLRWSLNLEYLLGEELTLCFQDLDGAHQFTTCYGDICKTVNALRDYARLLEMACDQWELAGFHRATYEYHAEKLRQIAGKLQAGIGYDYDAAVERCRKKQLKKKKSDDIGEDAMILALRRAQAIEEKKMEEKNATEPNTAPPEIPS